MFTNALMLAGLGAAVIPLVIHLLSRARYRNMQWGAMMFLRGAAAAQSHRARLRQWALLGLRMALVALLAVALARPVTRGRWGAAATQGSVTAVVILDCSFSMASKEAGRTRFDKAREAVLQILGSLRKGDEVALVLLGDTVEARPPSSNLQMVARDIAEREPSSGSCGIAEGLEAARRVLQQPSRPNRELYIVTDRQAVGWRGLLDRPAQAKWVNDPAGPTRCYVVAVGGEDVDNVAVTSVDLVESVAVRTQQAEVEVGLRNFGPVARVGLEMRLSVTLPSGETRRLKKVTVTTPADSRTSVRIPVTFDQVGSHVLTAEIAAPGLEADNRLDSAVDVINPIEVLIVSGDETGAAMQRESFFPRLALSPFAMAGRRQGDPAVVTVKSAEEWGSVSLNRYQVVFLANVPQVTADQARALEQRVYEGAGLIIAPGNLSRIDNYNSILYRDGQGLLPARLEPPVAADGSAATGLLGMEMGHPVFRFRRGADLLPGAIIGRYFPTLPRQADARVLATYTVGLPFLVEGPRGRGRVLLLTTPLDADWNMLPLYPFYLPFVQSMVRYAAAPSLPPRNLSPGEAILATFDSPVDEVRLERDGQAMANVAITAGGTQVRCPDTFHPGIYRMTARLRDAMRTYRTYHFVVPAPRQESDLAPLSAAQWEQVQSALHCLRIDPLQESLSTAIAFDRGGQDLWLPLLACVVALAVTEVFLSRRWGRMAP